MSRAWVEPAEPDVEHDVELGAELDVGLGAELVVGACFVDAFAKLVACLVASLIA